MHLKKNTTKLELPINCLYLIIMISIFFYSRSQLQNSSSNIYFRPLRSNCVSFLSHGKILFKLQIFVFSKKTIRRIILYNLYELRTVANS